MPKMIDMTRGKRPKRPDEYEPSDMLNKVQLAAALSVSTRTIDRWIATGEAPTYVVLPSNRLRWRWSDVMRWLEARRVEGPEKG
jgi:predicted DNA-binding transcriptional regulator AlpA